MSGAVVPLLMFVIGVGVVMGGYALVTWMPGALTRKRIDDRISEVARPVLQEDTIHTPALRRQVDGAMPGIDRLFEQTGPGNWFATLIEQAGVRMGVSTLILISLASAAVLGLAVAVLARASWGLLPGAIAGIVAPTLLLMRKRTSRLRKFEEMFPEALDLLSRAIRAGHAFTTAVGMVADEASDPIGPEFRKTFDEQNFGMPLKDALLNLSVRVPLMDVHFFVTAVLIQRETGGNLSEILDNLSSVVRERFKILRQVRVYTAHGRLTGYVLMALPAALAIALSFINPDHINVLFNEKMGRMLLLASIIMQTIGYFWIRKVVKIEV
jgi:tight adherence protein B